MWILPFALLFLAVAIGELGRFRVRRQAWPLPFAVAVLLFAALFLSGPLPDAYYRPSNFTNHDDLQVAYWGERTHWGSPSHGGVRDAAIRTKRPRVSAFYGQLHSEPGEFEIAEGPWFGRWELTPFHHYQRVHGRSVVVGFVGITPGVGPVPLWDARLAFRHLVDLREPQRWVRPSIRYVVLHRDVGVETGAPAPDFDFPALLELYRTRFGPPVFEDATIAVFRTAQASK